MSERYDYYSWEDGFSTDLDWKKNKRGKKVEIRCNGIVQEWVICCLTGERGFVKKVKVDEENKAVRHNDGNVMEYYVGEVSVEWVEW